MGFLDYRRPFLDAYLPSLENPFCDSLFHDENIRGDKRGDRCFISQIVDSWISGTLDFRLQTNNTFVTDDKCVISNRSNFLRQSLNFLNEFYRIELKQNGYF